MAIGSISNYISPAQGYFNTGGSLLKYMTSLSEQKKTASSNYFNQSLFGDLGKVGSSSASLQTQLSGMASLNQFSSSIGKTASYSTSGVLSANVAKSAPVSGYTKTDVNVSQLASAQVNTGSALNANENSFGVSFSINIMDNLGKTNTFSVSLTEQDNNKSAMQSMADKINSAGAGLKASLIEDKGNGTVSIQLTGAKTGGNDGKFTVTDTSAANLGNVSQESKNAVYSVNGKESTSQSNENVRITDGVTATLNKAGATQITYQPDAAAAASSVQKFVDAFNSLKSAASGSASLTKQLNDAAANYSRALGYSGIGMDSKGNLSITDEKKLSQSISDGSFAKNFQGANSFGSKVSEISRNAYRTAYDSAVQANFKGLMDSAKSSANSWSNNYLSLTSGLIFNMLV